MGGASECIRSLSGIDAIVRAGKKQFANPSTMTTTITESAGSDPIVERKGNTWKIPAGSHEVFTLTASVDNEGELQDRFIAVAVECLKWNTSDSLSGLTEFTFGLEKWETEPVLLEN